MAIGQGRWWMWSTKSRAQTTAIRVQQRQRAAGTRCSNEQQRRATVSGDLGAGQAGEIERGLAAGSAARCSGHGYRR